MPRHGSATGTATERQQPLPCRLQAPAGNAAVFPGQAPRFGEPFFLGNVPELSYVPDARSAMRQGRYRQSQLAAYRRKGACRQTVHAGGQSGRSGKTHVGRTGKERMAAPPRARPCGRSRAVIAAGLRRWGCPPQVPVGSRPDRPPFRSRSAVDTGRSRGEGVPPAGKGAALYLRGLPFAGFWSMEARSSKHTPAAARGARQCATAHFSLSSGHGAGAAAGRVAGSGPVWKITTLLED